MNVNGLKKKIVRTLKDTDYFDSIKRREVVGRKNFLHDNTHPLLKSLVLEDCIIVIKDGTDLCIRVLDTGEVSIWVYNRERGCYDYDESLYVNDYRDENSLVTAVRVKIFSKIL